MNKFLLLSLAGALGTLSRYALAGWVQKWSGGMFPFGTFAVNVLGSFLFGIVWALAEERMLISGETRFIILTGFMGAFTTFSTFMFESSALMQDSEWLYMSFNILGQCALGLVALLLGLALGRMV